MFVGAINPGLRAMLAEMAPRWRGRDVSVGCSGNLTVERILAAAEPSIRLHGNDVSLYSCALGAHASGSEVVVRLTEAGEQSHAWLAPYLDPGVPTLATLLLLMEFFKSEGRQQVYHQRMEKAYRARWDQMHAETVTRVEKALDGLHLASFTQGDVMAFVASLPDDSVVVSFPPTYEGGYEKLYAKIDAVLRWEAPSYEVFTEERFKAFADLVRSKREWVTARDHPDDEHEAQLVGVIQNGERMKPLYVYASEGHSRVVLAQQKIEAVPYQRATALFPTDAEIGLIPLTGAQLNTLRAEYLARGIVPGGAQWSFGVVVNNELVGALGFSVPMYFGGAWCDVFQLADFCVRPSPYQHLAKLLLYAARSREMRIVLEMRMGRRVETLGTAVFTDKPVSMKYRGLYELVSRREGALSYRAAAGSWSLQEGFATWRRKHGQTRA